MSEDPQTKIFLKEYNVATREFFSGRFLLCAIAILLYSACTQRKELVDQPLYEGPTSSLDSINTVLSDSGLFVTRIQAPKQNDYESGDTEWPLGVFVEYYNKKGEVTTVFSANHVYYTKEEGLYHAAGNVVVRNRESGDELTTEELFWDEVKEEYYTEKFVTINTDGEVHTGEGLTANQNFTSYQILKPSGTFVLDEENRDMGLSDENATPSEPKKRKQIGDKPLKDI